MTYEFRANITLTGALIYVEAESEKEAWDKANKGEWVDDDTTTASYTDWDVTSLPQIVE